MTPGVETTTGPLGQGFANAVGMALAEKLLAQRFNRPEFEVVDHHTWVFMGDGCLMEGISHEAASLAGTWGLNKLIAVWDDNHISIDGNVARLVHRRHAGKRFEAYGWNVIRDVDGHDADAIKRAIEGALASQDKPTLVCCRTTIGFGSPSKAGKESSHGAPLGKDEIVATREALDWPHAPFEIPQEIRDGWRAGNAGLVREDQWNTLVRPLRRALSRTRRRTRAPRAQRTAGQLGGRGRCVHREAAGRRPGRRLAQGLADGAGSLRPAAAGTDRRLGRPRAFQPHVVEGQQVGHFRSDSDDGRNANYVYYGVREFAMTAISNGLGLHECFIPYDATFLVFSDYARNAVRMSALMGAHAIHVYTHDSIGLGEDGPTHQPIEHVASLRYIPGNDVWRPCDAVESAVCLARGDRTARRPELPGVHAPEPRAPAAHARSRSPTSVAAATSCATAWARRS